MIKTLYYCDKCGREITDRDIPMVSVYEQERDLAGNGDIVNELLTMHLCKECCMKLTDYLTGVDEVELEDDITEVLSEPAEEPQSDDIEGEEEVIAEEPKPRRGSYKGLDIGKIKALYNAGWSTRKIADEMGCSQRTICNYLKREEG